MGQNKAQKAAAARALLEQAQAQAANTPAVPPAAEGITLPVVEMSDADALIGGPKAAAKVAAKVAKVQASAAAKPKAEPRPTCPATKKDGTACTAKCAEGKGTCVDHQPAWDRLTHEEHVAFGQWLRKAKAADVVEVIGWWRAKQIAKDVAGPVPTEQEQQIEQ